jgi:hypothetical protein
MPFVAGAFSIEKAPATFFCPSPKLKRKKLLKSLVREVKSAYNEDE